MKIARLKSGVYLSPVILIASMAIGCASKDPGPVAQLATTKAAISQAESENARKYAPVELNSAKEKLAQAEEAMRSKNHDQARRLAEQAEADAKLAESKAHSEKSMQAVEELQRSIRTLREEIERKSR